jgi:copper chaperone
MSKQYNVAGMTCSGCAKSLTSALSKAAPAAEFTVDHAAGLVSVKGDVSADTVKQVVEAGGFDYLGEAA